MEPKLPTYIDLMFPTLQALEDLGGSAPWAELDKKVQEVAGLTDTQMAVEYPASGQQTGSKVVHRMAWARSYLKLLDAVENEVKGVWKLTPGGRNYLRLSDGSDQLISDEHRLRVGRSPDLFLRRVKEEVVDDGKVFEISVRDLIAEWGVSRRGSAVVDRIVRDLALLGLATDPPFDTVPLHKPVTVVLKPTVESQPAHAEPADEETSDITPHDTASVSHTVTIGSIATADLVGVARDQALVVAQSLMESNDYSQLAVLSGERSLKGAISWESIARARLYGGRPERVSDAMISKPVIVPDDSSLLEQVGTIADAGFVFVQNSRDDRIVGIVTTADLSLQFGSLAKPFLLIGEIERWLRQALDGEFTADELAQFVDPDDPERQVENAENLTFGEYQRLCEHPDAWEHLGWPADKKTFTKHLEEVRQIRNSIMHFSPDPVADEDIAKLNNLLRWVKSLSTYKKSLDSASVVGL